MGKTVLEKRAELVDAIAQEVAGHFRTFGGGQVDDWNPLTHWKKDGPIQFALGVEVRNVVEFVLLRYESKTKKKKPQRQR